MSQVSNDTAIAISQGGQKERSRQVLMGKAVNKDNAILSTQGMPGVVGLWSNVCIMDESGLYEPIRISCN